MSSMLRLALLVGLALPGAGQPVVSPETPLVAEVPAPLPLPPDPVQKAVEAYACPASTRFEGRRQLELLDSSSG